jgi:hypothetical protein
MRMGRWDESPESPESSTLATAWGRLSTLRLASPVIGTWGLWTVKTLCGSGRPLRRPCGEVVGQLDHTVYSFVLALLPNGTAPARTEELLQVHGSPQSHTGRVS